MIWRDLTFSGQQARGQIIGQDLGHVEYLAFSPENTLVAACVEKEVLILDSKVRAV